MQEPSSTNSKSSGASQRPPLKLSNSYKEGLRQALQEGTQEEQISKLAAFAAMGAAQMRAQGQGQAAQPEPQPQPEQIPTQGKPKP